ncbi:hypothetical protein H310_11617 [Aphanomyces invadans]|uniref:Uncharacterized protein n=1 Tax=Aphanomyces invadans TaxID=157072 RepID=A0A024TNS5_9STRA|nr:hypothetical protein H310_11617 [Aphanomyces invadans]ETV94977.1 hypothetical protein H310_11617 [Aphanomyces invadans]|eukprot:XP_008876568.1 hypothetical protein H310_11617 [Aphanomyces invadans]
MKLIIALTVIAGAASATHNETSVSRQLQEAPPSFCLLTSYLRGVGTLTNCPKGEKGSVFEDQGLFCCLKEYGRGDGYPWKFDEALSRSGMFKRCEKDNGGRGKPRVLTLYNKLLEPGPANYEQFMALYQQQQMQANAQMELNQRLMAQRRATEHHDHGLPAAAASSIRQAEALEDIRRPPPTVQFPAAVGVQKFYGFQEVPKAPSFNGRTNVQKRRLMDQCEAYMREISLANAQHHVRKASSFREAMQNQN